MGEDDRRLPSSDPPKPKRPEEYEVMRGSDQGLGHLEKYAANRQEQYQQQQQQQSPENQQGQGQPEQRQQQEMKRIENNGCD